MSGEAVLMTLIGGVGTIFGPLVGAAIVVSMQNYLAQTGEWVLVIQGAIFVVVVLAFRPGIVGEMSAWFARRRGRANADVETPAPQPPGQTQACPARTASSGTGRDSRAGIRCPCRRVPPVGFAP